MLNQEFRDLLAATIPNVLLTPLDCQNFVNAVQPGSWNAIVPVTAAYAAQVNLLVEAADGQGWLRAFVDRLATTYAARPEFRRVLVEIDAAVVPATAATPFEEVLLAGGRPFANRRTLRTRLRELTDRAGASVLLVDGDPRTGKSFSYYLISHAAQDFVVNRFKLGRLPKPDVLADEILGRLFVTENLPPMGPESAERWAEKLADIVARAIQKEQKKRILIFDEFSDTPLPDGTTSLIVRLAQYADEELRPYLRVVLMRFRSDLPQELDDVVLRDSATPFTATDMVAVVMQVARARAWPVSEPTIVTRINDYHTTPNLSLNDRFKFLRGLLGELESAQP